MKERQLQLQLVQEHIVSPVRVNEDRTRAALAFLDQLGPNVAAPQLRVAITGELAFVWEDGDKFLIIHPTTDGKLTYVAEFGRERRKGYEIFALVIPTVLQEMLDAFPAVTIH